MDVVAFIALVAFAVAAVLGFIQKQHVVALIATGLFLLTLNDVGVKIG